MASVPNQRLRQTWKYFVAAWFIPLFLISAAIAEDRGHLPTFAFPIITLLFFAAGLTYGIPYMRRQISLRDVVLFGMLMPFGIWFVMVCLKLLFFPHANGA